MSQEKVVPMKRRQNGPKSILLTVYHTLYVAKKKLYIVNHMKSTTITIFDPDIDKCI